MYIYCPSLLVLQITMSKSKHGVESQLLDHAELHTGHVLFQSNRQ